MASILKVSNPAFRLKIECHGFIVAWVCFTGQKSLGCNEGGSFSLIIKLHHWSLSTLLVCWPATVSGKVWWHQLPVLVVPAHGLCCWVWVTAECRPRFGSREYGRTGIATEMHLLVLIIPALRNPSRRLCPGGALSALGSQKSILGLCSLVEPPTTERLKTYVENNELALPSLSLNERSTALLAWMS